MLLCRNISLAQVHHQIFLVAKFGGADGDRTRDLLTASQALSQLSYSPLNSYITGYFSANLTPQPAPVIYAEYFVAEMTKRIGKEKNHPI